MKIRIFPMKKKYKMKLFTDFVEKPFLNMLQFGIIINKTA